ncbi:MAG: hypothetical protein JW727_03475 [Candidatus Aenigmarchaeota archaeon]|nr:hypothetical protein [Candidatus Aenigmarchaeota archaeon]
MEKRDDGWATPEEVRRHSLKGIEIPLKGIVNYDPELPISETQAFDEITGYPGARVRIGNDVYSGKPSPRDALVFTASELNLGGLKEILDRACSKRPHIVRNGNGEELFRTYSAKKDSEGTYEVRVKVIPTKLEGGLNVYRAVTDVCFSNGIRPPECSIIDMSQGMKLLRERGMSAVSFDEVMLNGGPYGPSFDRTYDKLLL